jgi:ketosteroid isomerase-like protein
MLRYRTALILILAACYCVGCQKEPIDTRAPDERAIREADAATLKAAQANDVDGAVANYADDASWLPPNLPLIHSKAAIRAGWAKLIGNPGFTIDWQINKLEVSRAGDLAYTIYTYQMTLDGANGKPITDQGKDMAVWKKQPDGAWKMVADAFNSDLAAKSQVKTPETRHKTTKRPPRKRHKTS